MRPGGLAVARARAHAGLLLALCGLVATTAFALIGLEALHGSAAREATREALAAGPATSAALEVAVATDQDDVRARVRDLPVDVLRSVHTGAFSARHDDTTLTLTARADDGLVGRSRIVDGEWPAAGGEDIHAALQADAADRLGVTVGDTLRIGRLTVVIDGTWLPNDPAATAWFGDPAVASGTGPEGHGPLVVSEDDLVRLPASATTSYVLTPRSSSDLAQLSRDLTALTIALDDTEVSETMTGGLPERLADLETTRAAGNGLLAVAYVLLVLVSLVACRQVVALLTEARRAESTLLRSRGATTSALTLAATAEAAIAATLSAAIGLGAATTVFTLADRGPSAGPAVLVATLCALATVALTAAATWSSARRAGLRHDQSRDQRGARTTILVLALAAAGVSVGQFISYDGPLSGSGATGIRVDPVTTLAPAAALAALALLGSTAATSLLRLLERTAVGRPGLSPALPARQLARRLPTFGVALVLVSLAVGFSILTATVDGTQTSLDEAAAKVRNGADLRLDLKVPPAADVGAEARTAPLIDLAKESAAVVLAPGRVDQDKISLLAAPATLPAVAAVSRHHADSAQITSALSAKPVGIAIESGPVDVRIETTGAPITGELRSALWLVDGRGQIAVRPLGGVGADQIGDGSVTRTTTVPPSPHGWRLLAVRASVTGASGDATIGFSGLPGAEQYVATLANGQSDASAMAGTVPTRLPVVITPALAAHIDARRGDTFDLQLPDSGFNQSVTVAGIASTLPGVVAARGVAADLPTLTAYALAHGDDVPSPSSVWVATDDPQAVEREAISRSIAPTTSTTAAPALSSRVVASALHVWWWAAGSVIVFAALATAAMNASLVRARRGELQVLRALGLTWRRQARLRTAELGGALGLGAVVGILAGVVTVLLTTGGLARSATPGRPAAVEPQLSLVMGGLLGLAGILVLSLLVVGVLYARRIRHQAQQPGWRGDVT